KWVYGRRRNGRLCSGKVHSGLPLTSSTAILCLFSKLFAESSCGELVRLLSVMRFNLVDRIVEVQPGRLIRAVKNLTLGEDYLADHFPTVAVMPGVLMLQTLV